MQTSIIWNQCTALFIKLSGGATTVVNGKVYHGGGGTDGNDDDGEYIVYCYDPSQQAWTTLPPLPVRRFGLGQIQGKLVAVGGWKKSSGKPTGDVYTYDEKSYRWKQKVSPMATARYSPGVLSLQSALIVAGGVTSSRVYIDTVEIFIPEMSQWYTTAPLPTACRSIALVAIGNTCYALGGYNHPSRFNQVLHASVDDLVRNAVPCAQATRSASGSPVAWNSLPSTPSYTPAAAVMADNLVAIGGRETADLDGGAEKKEVYMYSPSSKSWVYVSDLPAPLSSTAVAVLSPTEVLVIGGWCGGRVDTIYKGTLHLLL